MEEESVEISCSAVTITGSTTVEDSAENREDLVEDQVDAVEDQVDLVEDHENTIEDHDNFAEDHENAVEEDQVDPVEDQVDLVEDHENTIEDHDNFAEDRENAVEEDQVDLVEGHENTIEDHDNLAEDPENPVEEDQYEDEKTSLLSFSPNSVQDSETDCPSSPARQSIDEDNSDDKSLIGDCVSVPSEASDFDASVDYEEEEEGLAPEIDEEQSENEFSSQTETNQEDEKVNPCSEDEKEENEEDNAKESDNKANSNPKPPGESNSKRPFTSVRGRRLMNSRNTSFQPPMRNNINNNRVEIPQQSSNIPQRYYKSDKSEDGGFVSNWGHRSNLIDQHGNFQRATTDLKNYIASYKSKYYFYFDLVNGRYPQFVRKFQNNLEIWRMSFNVYASGFADYITHLGEIHAFYQMEMVDNELRWVYKDFNFYPNKMRYGFRVNSFDIADVHSRFVKFICLRDCIIKQFPYVNIQHKIFIFRKFDENMRMMLSRLGQVKLVDGGTTETAAGPTRVSEDNESLVSSTVQVPVRVATLGSSVATSIGLAGDRGVRGFQGRKEVGGPGVGGDYVSRQFKPNYHRPDALPMNRRAGPISNFSNRPPPQTLRRGGFRN